MSRSTSGNESSPRRKLPCTPLAGLVVAAATLLAWPVAAASRDSKASPAAPAAVPASFAPMAADRELASIWNDPDFQRRLLGSYGFASDAEPRLQPDELAVYREQVVPALTNTDSQKAIATLLKLAQPKASAVFDFTLGNLYFQNDDLTNAVKCFEAALAKFPDYRRAQKNLAFARVRAGHYAEAIKPLTRTIALGEADGKVFGLLGFVCLNQGRFVSAEAAYRQALIFEPDNLDFKLGLVKCSLSTANYDYALHLLDELIEQFPERDSLWSLQANIYIQKDQAKEAAVSLETLRRLGRASAPNLFLLGDLYLSQEARDLALGAYLEAMDKDGGQNLARALRAAQILVSRGAWDEARRLFAKMRGAGTGLSGADELKLLKLESRVAMATGEGAKAIATLEQIIQKDPLDGEALLLAGDYYAKNGEPEKAEFRYETAGKITGFEADACLKHAVLLVQSRKYPQAAELLRKAQKLKPRDNVQRYLDRVEQLARSGAGRS